jgi:threonine/homoserine/homoserine lactone efflux protein
MPAVTLGLRLAASAYLIRVAAKLWRHGAVDFTGAPVTPWQVFLTTLLNPKALIFALAVIPFAAATWWLYLLGFLVLLVTVSLGWIALGATLARAAGAVGRGRLVPRLGAAAVGVIAMMLMVSSLLRQRKRMESCLRRSLRE